ncbi:MAG: hypothetical protein MI741_22430 [Rhodospirillales bacterium]|nr:hypothetical protein [Rhodospirillales bacterium]
MSNNGYVQGFAVGLGLLVLLLLAMGRLHVSFQSLGEQPSAHAATNLAAGKAEESQSLSPSKSLASKQPTKPTRVGRIQILPTTPTIQLSEQPMDAAQVDAAQVDAAQTASASPSPPAAAPTPDATLAEVPVLDPAPPYRSTPAPVTPATPAPAPSARSLTPAEAIAQFHDTPLQHEPQQRSPQQHHPMQQAELQQQARTITPAEHTPAAIEIELFYRPITFDPSLIDAWRLKGKQLEQVTITLTSEPKITEDAAPKCFHAHNLFSTFGFLNVFMDCERVLAFPLSDEPGGGVLLVGVRYDHAHVIRHLPGKSRLNADESA